MLSTIALFVMGIAAVAFRRRRGRIALKVVREDARRDLAFFFPVFLLLVIAGTIPMSPVVRHVLAVGLLIVYAITSSRKTGKKNARSRRASSRTTFRAIRPRRRRNAMAAMPMTNSAMVESIRGAPTIAPRPTAVWAAAESRPVSRATAGINVSGKAVPTAARTLPTAASAICNRWPAHSTPLVKSSEPTRMIAKLRARISALITKLCSEEARSSVENGAATRIGDAAVRFPARIVLSGASTLKSAENMAAIAAKAGNDAYNIRSGHRRARVRDQAAGQNVIRPMIARVTAMAKLTHMAAIFRLDVWCRSLPLYSRLYK